MPNIPPLITHTPNAQSLYAAAGSSGGGSLSYQVSTNNPSTTFGLITLAINLKTTMGLTFTAGKAYLLTLELTIRRATTAANTSDSMVMAIQSGGIVGRSAIYPLWNIGADTANVGFTCVVPIANPGVVNLTFGNPNETPLAQTYTITVQSLQAIELGTA